jgi:hypothetical protein
VWILRDGSDKIFKNRPLFGHVYRVLGILRGEETSKYFLHFIGIKKLLTISETHLKNLILKALSPNPAGQNFQEIRLLRRP